MGNPLPAEEAAATMQLPPGFKATLFAAEPDVTQPIAFTFDDRGRLWFVESLSYPTWKADNTGSDRVTILEDTDGDGRHDKRTVFFDRGVNLSEGAFAHSVGETDDARTALRFLRGRYPDLPFTLAGFSFGSRIAIKISEGATRAFAVGFPTIYPDRSYVREASTPLVFVQSTHDEFGPLADLEPFVASLPRSPKLLTIEAADHFFAGALEKLEDVVAAEAASAPV